MLLASMLRSSTNAAIWHSYVLYSCISNAVARLFPNLSPLDNSVISSNNLKSSKKMYNTVIILGNFKYSRGPEWISVIVHK